MKGRLDPVADSEGRTVWPFFQRQLPAVGRKYYLCYEKKYRQLGKTNVKICFNFSFKYSLAFATVPSVYAFSQYCYQQFRVSSIRTEKTLPSRAVPSANILYVILSMPRPVHHVQHLVTS
jgi:hypothetical protein